MLAHIDNDPDSDIIPRLRVGDERALGTLMDRHLSTLHALAFHMLGDNAMAEDVTQTVFLKTWQMVPNWAVGNAKLRTWMCRIATHQCLDILRKKNPHFTDDVPEMTDGAASADSEIISRERSTSVASAVARLPATQRAALTLCYYEELSQREAAGILGVSEKAYESLLSRARKTLRKTLDPELLKISAA